MTQNTVIGNSKFVPSSDSPRREWEFIVFGSSLYGLEVNTISLELKKSADRDINKPMSNFVQHTKSAVHSTLIKIMPGKVLQQITDMRCVVKSASDPSYCAPLNFFNSVHLPLIVGIPHCWAILNCRSENSIVGFIL